VDRHAARQARIRTLAQVSRVKGDGSTSSVRSSSTPRRHQRRTVESVPVTKVETGSAPPPRPDVKGLLVASRRAVAASRRRRVRAAAGRDSPRRRQGAGDADLAATALREPTGIALTSGVEVSALPRSPPSHATGLTVRRPGGEPPELEWSRTHRGRTVLASPSTLREATRAPLSAAACVTPHLRGRRPADLGATRGSSRLPEGVASAGPGARYGVSSSSTQRARAHREVS